MAADRCQLAGTAAITVNWQHGTDEPRTAPVLTW